MELEDPKLKPPPPPAGAAAFVSEEDPNLKPPEDALENCSFQGLSKLSNLTRISMNPLWE